MTPSVSDSSSHRPAEIRPEGVKFVPTTLPPKRTVAVEPGPSCPWPGGVSVVARGGNPIPFAQTCKYSAVTQPLKRRPQPPLQQSPALTQLQGSHDRFVQPGVQQAGLLQPQEGPRPWPYIPLPAAGEGGIAVPGTGGGSSSPTLIRETDSSEALIKLPFVLPSSVALPALRMPRLCCPKPTEAVTNSPATAIATIRSFHFIVTTRLFGAIDKCPTLVFD